MSDARRGWPTPAPSTTLREADALADELADAARAHRATSCAPLAGVPRGPSRLCDEGAGTIRPQGT